MKLVRHQCIEEAKQEELKIVGSPRTLKVVTYSKKKK